MAEEELKYGSHVDPPVLGEMNTVDGVMNSDAFRLLAWPEQASLFHAAKEANAQKLLQYHLANYEQNPQGASLHFLKKDLFDNERLWSAAADAHVKNMMGIHLNAAAVNNDISYEDAAAMAEREYMKRPDDEEDDGVPNEIRDLVHGQHRYNQTRQQLSAESTMSGMGQIVRGNSNDALGESIVVRDVSGKKVHVLTTMFGDKDGQFSDREINGIKPYQRMILKSYPDNRKDDLSSKIEDMQKKRGALEKERSSLVAKINEYRNYPPPKDAISNMGGLGGVGRASDQINDVINNLNDKVKDIDSQLDKLSNGVMTASYRSQDIPASAAEYWGDRASNDLKSDEKWQSEYLPKGFDAPDFGSDAWGRPIISGDDIVNSVSFKTMATMSASSHEFLWDNPRMMAAQLAQWASGGRPGDADKNDLYIWGADLSKKVQADVEETKSAEAQFGFSATTLQGENAPWLQRFGVQAIEFAPQIAADLALGTAITEGVFSLGAKLSARAFNEQKKLLYAYGMAGGEVSSGTIAAAKRMIAQKAIGRLGEFGAAAVSSLPMAGQIAMGTVIDSMNHADSMREEAARLINSGDADKINKGKQLEKEAMYADAHASEVYFKTIGYGIAPAAFQLKRILKSNSGLAQDELQWMLAEGRNAIEANKKAGTIVSGATGAGKVLKEYSIEDIKKAQASRSMEEIRAAAKERQSWFNGAITRFLGSESGAKIKEAVIGGLEQGAMQGAQTILINDLARKFYDKNRDLMDGVGEGAAFGLITTALLNASTAHATPEAIQKARLLRMQNEAGGEYGMMYSKALDEETKAREVTPVDGGTYAKPARETVKPSGDGKGWIIDDPDGAGILDTHGVVYGTKQEALKAQAGRWQRAFEARTRAYFERHFDAGVESATPESAEAVNKQWAVYALNSQVRGGITTETFYRNMFENFFRHDSPGVSGSPEMKATNLKLIQDRLEKLKERAKEAPKDENGRPTDENLANAIDAYQREADDLDSHIKSGNNDPHQIKDQTVAISIEKDKYMDRVRDFFSKGTNKADFYKKYGKDATDLFNPDISGLSNQEVGVKKGDISQEDYNSWRKHHDEVAASLSSGHANKGVHEVAGKFANTDYSKWSPEFLRNDARSRIERAKNTSSPEARKQILEEARALIDLAKIKEGSHAWDTNSGRAVPVGPQSGKEEPMAAVRPKVAKEEPMNVWYSSGENAQFSNLADRPFEFEGRKYRSVEQAYQSLKSGQFHQATYDKFTKPGMKVRGPKAKGDNIGLMSKLMRASFEQNPEAMAELRSTGNREITHTQDKGIWSKEFPRILSEIRGASQEAGRVAPSAPSEPVLGGDRPWEQHFAFKPISDQSLKTTGGGDSLAASGRPHMAVLGNIPQTYSDQNHPVTKIIRNALEISGLDPEGGGDLLMSVDPTQMEPVKWQTVGALDHVGSVNSLINGQPNRRAITLSIDANYRDIAKFLLSESFKEFHKQASSGESLNSMTGTAYKGILRAYKEALAEASKLHESGLLTQRLWGRDESYRDSQNRKPLTQILPWLASPEAFVEAMLDPRPHPSSNYKQIVGLESAENLRNQLILFTGSDIYDKSGAPSRDKSYWNSLGLPKYYVSPAALNSEHPYDKVQVAAAKDKQRSIDAAKKRPQEWLQNPEPQVVEEALTYVHAHEDDKAGARARFNQILWRSSNSNGTINWDIVEQLGRGSNVAPQIRDAAKMLLWAHDYIGAKEAADYEKNKTINDAAKTKAQLREAANRPGAETALGVGPDETLRNSELDKPVPRESKKHAAEIDAEMALEQINPSQADSFGDGDLTDGRSQDEVHADEEVNAKNFMFKGYQEDNFGDVDKNLITQALRDTILNQQPGKGETEVLRGFLYGKEQLGPEHADKYRMMLNSPETYIRNVLESPNMTQFMLAEAAMMLPAKEANALLRDWNSARKNTLDKGRIEAIVKGRRANASPPEPGKAETTSQRITREGNEVKQHFDDMASAMLSGSGSDFVKAEHEKFIARVKEFAAAEVKAAQSGKYDLSDKEKAALTAKSTKNEASDEDLFALKERALWKQDKSNTAREYLAALKSDDTHTLLSLGLREEEFLSEVPGFTSGKGGKPANMSESHGNTRIAALKEMVPARTAPDDALTLRPPSSDTNTAEENFARAAGVDGPDDPNADAKIAKATALSRRVIIEVLKDATKRAEKAAAESQKAPEQAGLGWPPREQDPLATLFQQVVDEMKDSKPFSTKVAHPLYILEKKLHDFIAKQGKNPTGEGLNTTWQTIPGENLISLYFPNGKPRILVETAVTAHAYITKLLDGAIKAGHVEAFVNPRDPKNVMLVPVSRPGSYLLYTENRGMVRIKTPARPYRHGDSGVNPAGTHVTGITLPPMKGMSGHPDQNGIKIGGRGYEYIVRDIIDKARSEGRDPTSDLVESLLSADEYYVKKVDEILSQSEIDFGKQLPVARNRTQAYGIPNFEDIVVRAVNRMRLERKMDELDNADRQSDDSYLATHANPDVQGVRGEPIDVYTERVPVLDSNGNQLVDDNGSPKFKNIYYNKPVLDENGKPKQASMVSGAVTSVVGEHGPFGEPKPSDLPGYTPGTFKPMTAEDVANAPKPPEPYKSSPLSPGMTKVKPSPVEIEGERGSPFFKPEEKGVTWSPSEDPNLELQKLLFPHRIKFPDGKGPIEEPLAANRLPSTGETFDNQSRLAKAEGLTFPMKAFAEPPIVRIFKHANPTVYIHESVHWMRHATRGGKSLFDHILGARGVMAIKTWLAGGGPIDRKWSAHDEERVATAAEYFFLNGKEALVNRVKGEMERQGTKVTDEQANEVGSHILQLSKVFQDTWRGISKDDMFLNQNLKGGKPTDEVVKAFDRLFVQSTGAKELSQLLTSAGPIIRHNDKVGDIQKKSSQRLVAEFFKEFVGGSEKDLPEVYRTIKETQDAPHRAEVTDPTTLIAGADNSSEGVQTPMASVVKRLEGDQGDAKLPYISRAISKVLGRGHSFGKSAVVLKKIQGVLNKNLSPASGLEHKDVMQFVGAHGERNAFTQGAIALTNAFNRALADYGNKNYGMLADITSKQWAAKRSEIAETVNEFYNAKDPAQKLAAYRRIPSDTLKETALNALYYKARIQAELLTRGIATGPVAMMVSSTLGHYFHKSYEAEEHFDKWRHKIDTEKVGAGLIHAGMTLYESTVAKLTSEINPSTGKAFTPSESRSFVDKLISDSENRSLSRSGILNERLDMPSSSPDSRDIWHDRDTFSPEIQKIVDDFKKVVQDPSTNLINTVRGLAHFITDWDFQKGIRDKLLSEGRAFISKPATGFPGPGRWGQVNEGHEPWQPFGPSHRMTYEQEKAALRRGPLDGLWVPEGVKEMIRIATEKTPFLSGDMGAFMNGMGFFNAMMKLSNTIYRPSTFIPNFFTSWAAYLTSGHAFKVKEFAKSAGDVFLSDWGGAIAKTLNYFNSNAGKKMERITQDATERRQFAIAMSAGESAILPEISFSLGKEDDGYSVRSATSPPTTLLGRVSRIPGSLVKETSHALMKMFAAGDAIPKLAAFRGEMADVAKMFPRMSSEQHMAQAHARMLNTVVAYEMTPRLVKMLSRFPIGGVFLQFSYHMARTAAGNLETGLRDFAQGFRRTFYTPEEGGKHQMYVGLRRLAMMYGMTMIPNFIANYYMNQMGFDTDEKRQTFKDNLVNQWDKDGINVPVTPISEFYNGRGHYVNLSRYLPFQNIATTIVRAISDINNGKASEMDVSDYLLHATKGMMFNMLQPLMQENALEAAWNLSRTGKDAYGKNVDSEVYGLDQRFTGMTGHLFNGLIPGFITDVFKSGFGQNSVWASNAARTMGVTIGDMHGADRLYSMFFGLTQRTVKPLAAFERSLKPIVEETARFKDPIITALKDEKRLASYEDLAAMADRATKLRQRNINIMSQQYRNFASMFGTYAADQGLHKAVGEDMVSKLSANTIGEIKFAHEYSPGIGISQKTYDDIRFGKDTRPEHRELIRRLVQEGKIYLE